MYYNLLRNWQQPFTVEMYCNINLSCLRLRSQLGRSIAVICIPWLGLTRICGGRGGRSSEVLPHIASYLSPRRGRPSPNLGGGSGDAPGPKVFRSLCSGTANAETSWQRKTANVRCYFCVVEQTLSVLTLSVDP